jgi:anion-transporting  ArsA/GET3 family ATPase
VTATAPATLTDLVDQRSIIVCCGSGGVGKTTTAAVVALEGARRGRRTVVVTIDPAKRLADALGLAGLTDTPSRIDGDWPGELWATMLDTKSTFDALVLKHAPTPEQGERILANRFYRNISGALSGTQEYMAMEKLYELHDESDFDLVVVDTPPTRHALDFLDAPRRLSRFLEHRLFRLLVAPSRGLVRAVNMAAQTFLRTVSKVVGGDVVDDAIAFFQAFEGMEEGFHERADRVNKLLSAPGTAFVLVASPRRDTVGEAHFFAERLEEADIAVEGLVVNRVHPSFGLPSPGSGRASFRSSREPGSAASTGRSGSPDSTGSADKSGPSGSPDSTGSADKSGSPGSPDSTGSADKSGSPGSPGAADKSGRPGSPGAAGRSGSAGSPVAAVSATAHVTAAVAAGTAERAATLAGTEIGGFYRNLADFQAVASREQAHLAGLAEVVAPAPVVWVPFLRSDVHDLAGLDEVAAHVFPRP